MTISLYSRRKQFCDMPLTAANRARRGSPSSAVERIRRKLYYSDE
jgi:hypothetical protein